MKKKEEEWQGEFQRKLKEFDGSRRNGLDPQRKTRKNEMEQSGKRDREGKKKELSGRKDPQKGINRACTYLGNKQVRPQY